MTTDILEYTSAIVDELANLAEMNGYQSLMKSLRAAAQEAERLQQAQRVAHDLFSPAGITKV